MARARTIDQWAETLETVHMWTQIVGKTKLANSPFRNQWWQIGFHLTPVGLTSGQMESAPGPLLDRLRFPRPQPALARLVRFDPHDSALSAFGRRLLRGVPAHDQLFGVEPIKRPIPTEVPDPIPFAEDITHACYDRDAVNRWFRIMAATDLVLQRYMSPFRGKSSPVLFYWGSFDLNVARFCGRDSDPPKARRASSSWRRIRKMFPAASGREMSRRRD